MFERNMLKTSIWIGCKDAKHAKGFQRKVIDGLAIKTNTAKKFAKLGNR